MSQKLHFVKITEPEIDTLNPNLHSDYAAKNLAIIHDGSFEFASMNALALKEALINSPELLALWGYKLVKITKKTEAKATGK